MSTLVTASPSTAIHVPTRGLEWVSKSDLIDWIRCPYAWWLLYRGKITRDDMVSEFQYRLMVEGSNFQDAVEASAEPITITPEQLPSILTTDRTLLATPTFENRKLHIFGRPDGIDAADGALIPIEIKSHKDVLRTDELELAFYWLVLEPLRKRRIEPRGLLMLRRDGEMEMVEVPIAAHRFDEVRRIVSEIRTARRDGVRPRVCGCHVCSVLKREEVMMAVTQREDLTMIHGIGLKFGPALEQMGILTWRELRSWKPRRVVSRMRRRKYFVSERQVRSWQHHAQSYQTGAPVAFGDLSPIPTSFIAIDLEYTPPHVWLIGVCIVREGRKRNYRTLWADGPKRLKANLVQLIDILKSEPSLPILTWAGEGADLPNLLGAEDRLLVEHPTGAGWEPRGVIADTFAERHLDVYQYVLHGLRLPIPSLGLKEVSAYFSVPRVSNIADGLEAQMMYAHYLQAKGPQKKAIKEQLTGYNRGDVEALVEVAGRVRALMPTWQEVPRGEPHKPNRSKPNGHKPKAHDKRTPDPERLWVTHLKTCEACWAAAYGQDGLISFCATGFDLMDRLSL